jgi:ribonuclease HIII
MNNTKNQHHVSKIHEYIYKCLQNDQLNDDDLVQIIELVNNYLNLKTISEYAKEYNLSYNGVKNNRNILTLLGHKFVADNL